MKLYHIHTPNAYDDLYYEGNTIEFGKKPNKFRENFLKRTSSVCIDTWKEDNGKTVDLYSPWENVLKNLNINLITKEQLKEVKNNLISYIHNSQIDRREMILEDVRLRHFPHLPSRNTCMWCTIEEGIAFWKKQLLEENIKIFEIEANGNIFLSTNTLLPDSAYEIKMMYEQALRYWNPNENDLRNYYDREYLVEGTVKLVKRIK